RCRPPTPTQIKTAHQASADIRDRAPAFAKLAVSLAVKAVVTSHAGIGKPARTVPNRQEDDAYVSQRFLLCPPVHNFTRLASFRFSTVSSWSTNASQAVIRRRILTRPLAPTQDLTVLRGAGRECGRRVEAGRLRPAPRQARHPTRRRLARSAGEGHQSPGRGPGRG